MKRKLKYPKGKSLHCLKPRKRSKSKQRRFDFCEPFLTFPTHSGMCDLMDSLEESFIPKMSMVEFAKGSEIGNYIKDKIDSINKEVSEKIGYPQELLKNERH